jgi:rhodanese-related sulfurtransferase
MPRNTQKRNRNINTRSGLSAFLRRPLTQLGIVAIVALVVVLIALAGKSKSTAIASDISVEQAYKMYQEGAFVLDVRRQDEWDLYHIPNTTLIPLDQLQSRLNELPKDKQIVVICHSGNRSKPGRDILLAAGFQAVSTTGGLIAWNTQGYPLDGPQRP